MTVALVHIFLPYAVLVLFAGFQPIRPGLLEAAQDLGAGAYLRWRRVILPLVAAPALSAFLFVFVLSASDYVTPQFVGGSSGVMLGVQVQANFTTVGNYPLGAATSLLMLAAFVALYFAMRVGLRLARARPGALLVTVPLPRRARDHDRGPALPLRAARGRRAVLVPQHGLAVAAVHGLLAALVPLRALRPGLPLGAREQPVRRCLDRRSSRSCSGTLASFGLARTRSRLRGPLALLFFLPITLPGLFIGLSMLVFFVRTNIDLSLTTVIIAHCVYVFPYFLLIAIAALERLDPALEEAAADLGANGWLRFWRVTMPQIWPLLVGATCLAFALSFDEFVITFFVIGPDGTLPLYIWSQLRRTVDPSINVVSTLLMTVTLVLWLVAFLFALRAARRRAASGDELVAEVVPL